MIEIYMEQVRDLLDSKPKKTGGLDVRQHPNKGFYGENDFYGAVYHNVYIFVLSECFSWH